MHEAHTAEGPIAFATTLNFSAVSKATLSRCHFVVGVRVEKYQKIVKEYHRTKEG